MVEATWIARYIAPLLPLKADSDIELTLDSTTDYSTKRPDLFFSLSKDACRSGRAIAAVEIKSPWAASTEKRKDLARVTLACIQYHKEDHYNFTSGNEAQVKIAVHLPGMHGSVYEVYLLKKIFIAVEIGSISLPTALSSRHELALVDAIMRMEILMQRIRKVKSYMLAYGTRNTAESPERLPASPSENARQKATKRTRRTSISQTNSTKL
ncbi:hypothetical protein SpCBS45565_g05172 [Spizellomyces sp. 'palustris']|nr:hypothetical protein SpCBS45565_g05172 [Spizellomyces sp. 'palustris']